MVLSLGKWKDIVYISQNVWKLMELGQDDIKESITYIRHLGIVTGKKYQVYILMSWQSSISQFYISMIKISNSTERDNIYFIMTSILQHNTGGLWALLFCYGSSLGLLRCFLHCESLLLQKASCKPRVRGDKELGTNAFLHWSSEGKGQSQAACPRPCPISLHQTLMAHSNVNI